MRVFVLCTGRCGSVTFYHACQHIGNYTCGHEEPNPNLQFPDNHIAINPQFRIRLDELLIWYPPSENVYVWLYRDFESVVKSYMRLGDGQWLQKFWRFYPKVKPKDKKIQAEKAVMQMYSDIHMAFDRFAVCYLPVSINTAKKDWEAFVEEIGAEGDMEAAQAEFDVKYNSSKARGHK